MMVITHHLVYETRRSRGRRRRSRTMGVILGMSYW
jgi:hypothetical protein